MYKKKTDKRKENIMIGIGLVIVVILLIISLLVSSDGFALKDTAMFIEKIIMYPAIYNNDDTENSIIEKNINEALKKEVEELKNTLELNKTLTDYKPINATVLSRNKSYWFNTMTIDKGKKAGIKKNMAVVTKNGLIGKVSRVSRNSSEVKLITSDDINFKVSVAIRTGDRDSYAILNGYDPKTNLIKVTGVDKTTPVNDGDVVTTSGLGEMFPTGIYIGKVEKQESDKYDLTKTLYVKTTQDFSNVHYVTVLGVK